MISLFFLEGDMKGLGLLVAAIFFVGFGIPIILYIIGFVLRSKGKKTAPKVLFILATVYLIISLGVCGSMM